MAKPGFLATPQAYALHNVLSGATLDAYLGGTTTATAFYSDKSLSTTLGSQLTADSEGRFSNFFLPGDIDIKLRLRHTATATDITFDYAAVDDSGGANATFKNRLINGSFAVNQRKNTSRTDDQYCFDRWYVLTQSAAIAPSELTNPETGAPTGIRLTQSNATPQRIGLAQIIESINCRDLRSEITTIAGRVRLSTTSAVRYAVIEWTGTADSVTSDVVNDWTSSTYTAGNFFISSNVNILAVGSVSCTAATWRALDALNATCGEAMNNIIVVVWTESTLAQNGTLDFNRVQYEKGGEATDFEARPFAIEFASCRRYYRKTFPYATTPAQNAGRSGAAFSASVAAGTYNHRFVYVFGESMRITPAVTYYNPDAANAQARNPDAGADCASTASLAYGGSADQITIFCTTPAGGSNGDSVIVHFEADAEL